MTTWMRKRIKMNRESSHRKMSAMPQRVVPSTQSRIMYSQEVYTCPCLSSLVFSLMFTMSLWDSPTLPGLFHPDRGFWWLTFLSQVLFL